MATDPQTDPRFRYLYDQSIDNPTLKTTLSVRSEPKFDFLDKQPNLITIPEEQQSEIDRQRDTWVKNESSWSFKGAAIGTGRVIARTPLRIADDITALISDTFVLNRKTDFEEKMFGDPKSAVEDIATEMGSWLGTFFIPGGYVAKGAKAASKAAGGAKVVSALGKTEKGRKFLKVGKIAGEGAVAGAVADFITTDTEDIEGTQALIARTEATVQGVFIGAGVNLTMHGASRIVGASLKKWRALREVRKATEGNADPQKALEKLKEAVEEENAVKEDIFADINKTDDGVADIDLDNLDNDGVIETPTIQPEAEPGINKDIPKKERPKKTVEQEMLTIEEFINRGQGLPNQIDRLVQLNKAVADKFNPILADLVKAIKKYQDNPAGIGRIKELVLSMELDVHRYRKLVELNAKVGNLNGKNLRAHWGDGANFSKPFTYKPEVLKRVNQVDSILDLINKAKNSPTFEKDLVDSIQAEINDLIDVSNGKKTLGELLDKKFQTARNQATEDIWGKYKKHISDQVTRLLVPAKAKQKAALAVFSDRVQKTVGDAIAPDNVVAKKANKALSEAADILNNPDKYKDSIEQVIDDISKSDKIPEDAKGRAIETLTDMLEGNVGKTLFEGLPQHAKLIKSIIKEELGNIGKTVRQAVKEGREADILDEVLNNVAAKVDLPDYAKFVLLNNIRAELGNAITAIKDRTIRDFINKELFRKFNLHEELDNLYDLKDKSIEEIREYLAKGVKRKPTPDDIKILQNQVRAARNELEVKSENAFVMELLQRLGSLPEYSGPIRSDMELFLGAFEKLRLNFMLSRPRTWLVGVPSGLSTMIYQPMKQAAFAFYKEVGTGIKDFRNFQKVKVGFQRALAELKATSEYVSNFSDAMRLMGEAARQGRPVFNPRSLIRHQEELVKEGVGSMDKIRVPLRDRQAMKELVHRYGVDTQENKNVWRNFLNDMIEGTPSTKVGKVLDPLFSLSFRMMGMFDEPMKFLGTMRAIRAEALQNGISKGLEGEALEQSIKDYMEEAVGRVDGMPQWKNNEKFDEIEQLGLAITFQQKYAEKYVSMVARSISQWSRGGDDAYYNPIKIAARMFLPFIKTPAVIAQFVFDNFPGVAQTKLVMQYAKKSPKHRLLKSKMAQKVDAENVINHATTPGQVKRAKETLASLAEEIDDLNMSIKVEEAETAAQAFMATTMLAGMGTLVANSSITGTGAFLTDDQRRRFLDYGWKPNHIRIGGVNVDYSRWEPFSTILSLTADYMHYMKIMDASGGELLEDEVGLGHLIHVSLAENFANKYFVRGLYELLKTVDSDTNIENTFVSYLSTLSPGIIRDISQVNEPFQTMASDMESKLKERMLGINPGQYRRNLLGEKVERVWSKEGLWGMVNPIMMSDLPDDPVLREIAGIRGTLGQARTYARQGIDTRKFRNDSNQTLYDAWMDEMSTIKIGRKTVRERLKKLFESKKYADTPVESFDNEQSRSEIVAKILSDYRKRAWESMLKKHPEEFRDENGQVWTDKKKSENITAEQKPSFTDLLNF